MSSPSHHVPPAVPRRPEPPGCPSPAQLGDLPGEPLPDLFAARPAPAPSAPTPSRRLVDAVADLGGPAETADLLAGLLTAAPAGSVPARLARVERGRALVLAVGSPDRARPVRFATGLGQPAVGDWCVVSGLRGRDSGIVEALAPRRTALVRSSGPTSVAQVLAGDVDTVAIVGALDRRLPVRQVERMLALVWDSGARPVVVLTKADLVDAAARADAVEVATRTALGVEVLTFSAVSGEGGDAVRALVRPGSTLALLGSSGAGKSTLANVLLAGSLALRTGEVRDSDARGRHTTTWRELVGVPGGGALVDTPGLRTVAMWASGGGVDAVFADVAELVGTCRFADCRHEGEPGCAIGEAVAAGEVAPERLEGWRTLQREAAWQASRHDARLRADTAKKWKQRSRDARGRARP